MQQPNVVLILTDQQRWDFIGYAKGNGKGNGITHTPNLDRMAQAGTIFHAAYCTAPLCSPSRAAMVSGRYGVNSGCFTNLHELPPHTPTFVQQLRAAGYRTGAVGKTHMEIHAYDSDLTSDKHRAFMDSLGWDDICEISGNGMFRTGIRCAQSEYLREVGLFGPVLRYYQKWSYFMEPGGDHNFVSHPWPFAEEHHTTAFVGREAVNWLQARDTNQPYFLHVGFSGPHSPIEPMPDDLAAYAQNQETAPWGNDAPPDWLPEGRRGYRAMITHIDRAVGEIYQCVKDRGELDRTIFVFTSDHGEMAGDHGLFSKTCFYEGSVHVPMFVVGPGIQRGQESHSLVETIDIGKTICELCGVAPHALDQGHSMVPVLHGESTHHRDTAYAEMGCDRMLFDGRYKLMWGEPTTDTRKLGRLHLDKPVTIPASPPRLYDLQHDPHELHNLVDDPAHQSTLMMMLQKLLARVNANVQTQPNKSRGEYRPVEA